MKKILPIFILFAAMAFRVPSMNKITIWMIGDSTMSVKELTAYPETGWGMPFTAFWDSTVTVENRALNGRSTRTFMEENQWQPIMNNMKEGDYVLIQFGHNDEVSTKKSYVTEKDFSINLIKYITDTRSRQANPVLITPVARRKFDSAGKVEDTHAVYAQIVRDVAKQYKVMVIDLNEKSLSLLQELGAKESVYLYNHLAVGEHPNYPAGKTDDTHFNEYGARRMAEIVLAEIRKSEPGLSSRIVLNK